MRRMEPCLLHLMGPKARSTTEFIKAIYGEDYNAIEKARVQVHEALVCLEKDGLIESKMCYAGPGKPERYWSLPGGSFPEGTDIPPLTERILASLENGPKRVDAIYKEVYTEADTVDRMNAEKRLSKALNRLKQKGLVIRCKDETTGSMIPSTWRLCE